MDLLTIHFRLLTWKMKTDFLVYMIHPKDISLKWIWSWKWGQTTFLFPSFSHRETSFWCFYFVHGLGQALWIPTVPEWPKWKLWRLESNLYRQQQCCKQNCCAVSPLKSSTSLLPFLSTSHVTIVVIIFVDVVFIVEFIVTNSNWISHSVKKWNVLAVHAPGFLYLWFNEKQKFCYEFHCTFIIIVVDLGLILFCQQCLCYSYSQCCTWSQYNIFSVFFTTFFLECHLSLKARVQGRRNQPERSPRSVHQGVKQIIRFDQNHSR